MFGTRDCLGTVHRNVCVVVRADTGLPGKEHAGNDVNEMTRHSELVRKSQYTSSLVFSVL
jgi:hypothetical protein